MDKWGVPPPGGESYASVTIRMREWYDSLIQDAVAVSHGGSMRVRCWWRWTLKPGRGCGPDGGAGRGLRFVDGQVTKHS